MTDHPTIYVARRLEGRSGQFAGLVLAALRTDYFMDLYGSLDMVDGSVISLWRADGLLLAHYPPLPGTDPRHVSDRRFDDLQPGQSHIFTNTNTFDGQPHLVARARLASQPIVVAYSRTLNVVLRDARFDSEVVVAAAALCIAAVLVLAHFVNQQFRAYEAAAGALAARETAERGLQEVEAKLLQGQKLEAVGRLSAGIAHDFNNLLTVVRASAEMMLGDRPGERATRRIATICQAADRGAALTQQMLAFSRQQMLTPRSLDLNGRLDSIAELLRSSVGGRVRLDLEPGTYLWPAYADAAQLEQALLNLVLNAGDAMPGGGVVAIRTANRHVARSGTSGALQPGDYVSVAVADTGIGMTPEVVHRAFDPFFTTKEQGRGSGLGLSQVVGFARQSGGDVLVETTPGAGTTITVLLPRSLHPALPEQPSRPELAGLAATEMPTVLLVDDDVSVREAAAAILRRHGFAVVEAEGGPAALRLAAQYGVGLVLTDYAMPEMTGTELASQLRQDAPARPVVFMTGFEPEPLHDERWVIRKPFDAEALCRILAEAWGEYRRSFSPA